MNSIWSDFARMIYNVEVEVTGPEEGDGGAVQAPPPEWVAPQQQSNFGALEYYGGTPDDQPTAYANGDDGPAVEEPPVVAQRRVTENETIGRNDPCWCGSGKKFKKCHGA
jgi:preprotein translocase subunit SecA